MDCVTCRLRLIVPAVCLAITLAVLACSEPPQPTVTLYQAVANGDLVQLKRHVRTGSDINVQDRDGNMPLHVAAAKGRWYIAKYLIKNGAVVDSLNRAGDTPLWVALLNGNTKLARLLMDHGAAFQADEFLQRVARDDVADKDVIEFLTANGADIDVRNADGDTSLHVAVTGGQRVLTRFLLLAGADVNARNAANRTPLQIAQESGNKYIVRMLMRSGAVAE